MKSLLPLVVLALGTSIGGARAASVDPMTLVRLSGSVLKIEVIRTQGGYSLGSGVVVAADRVVTSCHVTRDARQIAVLLGGVRMVAQAQRVDAGHDLCLLHVPGVEASRAMPLGQAETLLIGEPLTAVGHTAGSLQSSSGEVIALHRLDGGHVVRVSNFFNSGASGGGLFDKDMRLVGILTFRLRGGLAHYFAVPAEWLQRDLRDAGEHDQPIAPRPASDLAFWERPLAAQPFFLRAAVLENENDWRALQPLAIDWLRHDATDAEPWYLLGLALERQNRPAEARHALACALAIAPAYPTARAELDRLPPRPEPAAEGTAPALPCHF